VKPSGDVKPQKETKLKNEFSFLRKATTRAHCALKERKLKRCLFTIASKVRVREVAVSHLLYRPLTAMLLDARW
jgi:hypothetical protein